MKVFVLKFVLLGIVPILYYPLGSNYSMSLKLWVILLCLIFIVFEKLERRDLVVLNDNYMFLLVIYIGLVISSLLLVGNIGRGLIGSEMRPDGIVVMLVYVLLFWFVGSFRKRYSLFLLLGGLIVSLIGILQYYGLDILPPTEISVLWNKVAYSTIGNPNFLGSYLVLLLPVAMYGFVGLKKWYGLVVYGVILYCLLATMSRGPWLGAMAAVGMFVLMLWLVKKFDWKRLGIVFVTSVALIGLFNVLEDGALLNRFGTIGTDIGEVVSGGENLEKAGSYRMFIWIRSLELVKENPLWGVGLEQLGYAFIDNYSEDMVQYWGRVMFVDRAHNEYLHIAVSTGIPSLLVYLTFLFMVLRDGWRNWRKDEMLLPVYAAVVGYLVQAFFNISVVSVAYLFWIYMGFLVNERRSLE